VPTAYDLRFRLDPASKEFSGAETIAVTLAAPQGALVMHARDVVIDRAVATFGGTAFPLATTARGEELVLAAPPGIQLPAGKGSLELRWHSTYSDDLDGFYVADGAVYSQFEPMDARRAFPCFDEPGFKVPFRISIEVPKGQQAFSNAPLLRREPGEGGFERFVFKDTKPIPSYLVALAAGRFSVLEDANPAPIAVRIIAPPGKAQFGKAAQIAAKKSLDALGNYFDYPYPFEKLDLVAVPDFAAGAMENPGLVTFREELLLVDRERSPRRQVRSMEAVVAHELGHQWFGDLVTMAWWDDLWLNEGFASFLEGEVLDRIDPAGGVREERLLDAQRAMDLDVLASARAVRQPVRTVAEAQEAFDPLTYDKGASVIALLGGWLGPDVLRDGLRKHVKQHAFGNATAADLFGALAEISKKPVAAVAAPYLDAPGIPLVRYSDAGPAGSRCEKQATLSVTAWSVANENSHVNTAGWLVPICDGAGGRCVMASSNDPCDGGGGAPPYRHGGRGYFRWEMAGKKPFDPLVALKDPAAVPADLLANSWASLRRSSGASPADSAALAAPFVALIRGVAERAATAGPPPGKSLAVRHDVDELLAVLRQADDVLPDADRVHLAKDATRRLRPAFAKLGFVTQPSDTDNAVLVRRALALFLADTAGDAEIRVEAGKIADAWLANPAAPIAPDTLQAALEISAFGGDERRWTALRTQAEKATDAVLRTTLLRALGSFDDPKLLGRSLAWAFSDAVRLQDVTYILRPAFGRRATRSIARAWIYANWSVVRKKLPGTQASRLTLAATGICDAKERAEAEAFFTKNLEGVIGAKRNLEETLEQDVRCESFRLRLAGPLASAFAKDAAAPK
jgi:alanyl aminopeptidase